MKISNKSTTLDELKPCPFCGGEPTAHLVGNEYTKKILIVVKCPTCRIERTDGAFRGQMEWLENTAIKNWNKRFTIKST